MKLILFHAAMVRAILDRRKTVTRRVVKPQPKTNLFPVPVGIGWDGYFAEKDSFCMVRPPYFPGDILYVREAWQYMGSVSDDSLAADRYIYRADWEGKKQPLAWRSSIHMPRKAARIFLRVTDVRAEKLQEINERGPLSAKSEGFVNDLDIDAGTGRSAAAHFAKLWDGTLKPADRALYGWDANPWVWAIEFERIGREESL